MIKSYLSIRNASNKGRGVFATQEISSGTTIEESPVIVMENADRILLDQTLLHDYIFEWGDDKKQCCMALGYVALYNHSYESNCEYVMDYESQTIRVLTMRDIQRNEELTINYNGDWDNEEKVWFDTV